MPVVCKPNNCTTLLQLLFVVKMAHSKTARKIIDIDNEKKIISDTETLQEILCHPSVKDKHVCVISITGTFRQGKSFLLNFLLMYLNMRYGKKVYVKSNWLEQTNGNLSGFQWMCGKERHTTGILMWPEIFLAKIPSGEEIAIVLLDTQGTFDNKTAKQNCAAIFAISTLISSVQIYNIKNQIDQSHLEHLECFSGWGQLAVTQNSNKPPFQNLWFLIRDWQCAYENEYGMNGGKHYLYDYLHTSDQDEEVARQNNNIKKLFGTLKCCLLPHPGKEVASNSSFKGEIKAIDKEFLHEVQQFVSAILAPENLIPKVVNGIKIKTGDLVNFIQTYCQHFMDENTPQLKSMYLATCYAHHDVILAEAKALYENAMNNIITDEPLDEIVLQQAHKIQTLTALEFIRKKNILGEEEIKKAYEEKFIQILDEKFLEYKKLNKVKLEKAKEFAELHKQFERTKLDYENKLEKEREERQLAYRENKKLEQKLLEQKQFNESTQEENRQLLLNLERKQQEHNLAQREKQELQEIVQSQQLHFAAIENQNQELEHMLQEQFEKNNEAEEQTKEMETYLRTQMEERERVENEMQEFREKLSQQIKNNDVVEEHNQKLQWMLKEQIENNNAVQEHTKKLETYLETQVEEQERVENEMHKFREELRQQIEQNNAIMQEKFNLEQQLTEKSEQDRLYFQDRMDQLEAMLEKQQAENRSANRKKQELEEELRQYQVMSLFLAGQKK